MTKKRKQLKFTTTGRSLQADIARHWELDEESLQSELCSVDDCGEVGSSYFGEYLVCGDHRIVKDYREF